MKSPECVCKTSDSTFAKSNAAISEEIQACLQKALTMMEEKQ